MLPNPKEMHLLSALVTEVVVWRKPWNTHYGALSTSLVRFWLWVALRDICSTYVCSECILPWVTPEGNTCSPACLTTKAVIGICPSSCKHVLADTLGLLYTVEIKLIRGVKSVSWQWDFGLYCIKVGPNKFLAAQVSVLIFEHLVGSLVVRKGLSSFV